MYSSANRAKPKPRLNRLSAGGWVVIRAEQDLARFRALRGADDAVGFHDLDDSAWPRADVRSTWRDQGRQGYDGMVWFRRVVPLEDEARLAGQKNELASLLGPPVYGGYEAYAGGGWIGRSRGWSAALRVPRSFAFPAMPSGKTGR